MAGVGSVAEPLFVFACRLSGASLYHGRQFQRRPVHNIYVHARYLVYRACLFQHVLRIYLRPHVGSSLGFEAVSHILHYHRYRSGNNTGTRMVHTPYRRQRRNSTHHIRRSGNNTRRAVCYIVEYNRGVGGCIRHTSGIRHAVPQCRALHNVYPHTHKSKIFRCILRVDRTLLRRGEHVGRQCGAFRAPRRHALRILPHQVLAKEGDRRRIVFLTKRRWES